MVLNVSIVDSFFLLSNIPLCRYTTICLSIHLWIDIWLLLGFGYDKCSCYEHGPVNIWMYISFYFAYRLKTRMAES
jgi:hypothetical protein